MSTVTVINTSAGAQTTISPLIKFAPVLQSVVLLLTAFIAIPEPYTWDNLGQFAVFALATIVTWWVPLLPGRWAGGLKTGAAILSALIIAAIPFFTEGRWNAANVIIVIIAVINALLTEVGVNMRADDLQLKESIQPDGTFEAPVADGLGADTYEDTDALLAEEYIPTDDEPNVQK